MSKSNVSSHVLWLPRTLFRRKTKVYGVTPLLTKRPLSRLLPTAPPHAPQTVEIIWLAYLQSLPPTAQLTAVTTTLEVPLQPSTCQVALLTVATTTLVALSLAWFCQNVLSSVAMEIQQALYKLLAQRFVLPTVATTTQQLPWAPLTYQPVTLPVPMATLEVP